MIGLVEGKRRARLQPAETMSRGLRADLGLGPTQRLVERPMLAAEHERLQAVMASQFASRR
ncbi:hypothetical protein [Jiella avicenniae]|uniref:Uncharacterized protein n=1 Tax=Jiella avicenniae TaxID=2907202 RepID=A0A9X1P5U3_9HYPH|nr:hypothetical protein [Jiella avicenniae]MCE7030314.1 hypothetical protein [Jiella avicenniae]